MGKRKSRLAEDSAPEAQVDFLITESNKNLDKGNYGSAEFKATEALSVAKDKLGFEHPLTGRANICGSNVFLASNKIGKARQMLEQALEIGDQCDDHALKAQAYAGLAEVAMRDPMGKKTERSKLSQEYWRLQREEEDRAIKFPSKPPPPVEPAPDGDEEEGEYYDDYQQYGGNKSAKKPNKKEPRGRDKEWALLKERGEKDKAIHEKELEEKERREGPRPPGDLSQYKDMDGGWQSSPDGKWLYHDGSNVFLQQSSGKYFRKNRDGGYDEVRQAQPQVQEAAKEEVEVPKELTGIVKTVVVTKGYGFIKQDNGQGDVWFKIGALDIRENTKVMFKLGRVEGRSAAVDIIIVAAPAPVAVVATPEPAGQEEEDVLEARPLFDIWGRPVQQKIEIKIVKEEKPAWDREVRSGVELLRGHQLVMEDYHAREQLGSLGTMFAIFDGHGGREASEFCSNEFGKYCEIEFRKKFPLELLKGKKVNPYQKLALAPCPTQAPTSYLSEIITNGFLEADKAFFERTAPQEGKEAVRAGTTGNVCFLRGPDRDNLQLITANVGDSRAVLCRAGKAVRLSEDHKPDRKDERARIDAAGGSVLLIGSSWRCTKGKEWGETRFKMPENQLLLATSRALGDRELKEGDVVTARPEITVENIGADDFFVILASDGVWDVLDDQAAVDVALKHWGNPDNMAKAVAQESLKKDTHDNTSALVFCFPWNSDRVKECKKADKEAKKKVKAKVVDMFGSDED